MIRRFVVSAGLVAALGVFSSAAVADGMKESVYKDSERHRVETLDRDSRLSRRTPGRIRDRYAYRPYYPSRYRGYRGYRAWDGRYGLYPRRHFFVSGVHGSYGSPVSYATVTYKTYVYYTPTYPSVSYGYPPYAHVYSLGSGPIYNKPCLC